MCVHVCVCHACYLIMQQKIEQRTKHPASKCREAFALFGAPSSGITPDAFVSGLKRLGFVLTDAEAAAAFRKIDHDGE